MRKWLYSIITDDEGDGDIVSILGILAMLVFLSLSVYTTINTGRFDYANFGFSVGAMLGGLGGGYWAKNSTPYRRREDDDFPPPRPPRG